MKRKLTKQQEDLLKVISNYIGFNNALPYDTIKSLSEFKSFDSTFNALLNAGYVCRKETNDFSNQFKLL